MRGKILGAHFGRKRARPLQQYNRSSKRLRWNPVAGRGMCFPLEYIGAIHCGAEVEAEMYGGGVQEALRKAPRQGPSALR